MDTYTPRHARLARKPHPATGLEVANTACAVLTVLLSALCAFAALSAILAPPVAHTTAPAQFSAIVCVEGRTPVHCQVAEIRRLSP
jgi:hypothetical protein